MINSHDDCSKNKTIDARRRKRVNRIKTVIIIIVFILFLIPTILCIILGIQLYKLQEQVNDLVKSNSGTTKAMGYNISGKYAYASETADKVIENLLSDYSANDQSGTYNDDSKDIALPGSDIKNQDDTKDPAKTKNIDNPDAREQNQNDGTGQQAASSEIIGGTGQSLDWLKNPDGNAQRTTPLREDTGETGQEIKTSDNKDSADANKDQKDVSRSSDNFADDTKENSNDNKKDNVKDAPEGTNKEQTSPYQDKKVYLTFDDGPSKNTDKILDILAEYNVKATFFVTGKTDEEAKNRYKRIVDEGHTLGMHSYFHNYKEIYKSLEDFDKDFTKLWNLLYDTTGYMPTLYRFPGGSLNQVSNHDMKDFIRYLNDKGMTYFDWNVVNGDAEGKDYTEEQMIDNVLTGVAKKKTPIVLMHDGQGKDKTVDSLPKILDELISGGAQVLPLDEDVPLIQQIKASSVK